MQADFSFGITWRLWTDDNLSRAEAATVCDLEITVGEESLTRNIGVNNCEHKTIFVSALPFAWWLCANFWRICHEPGLPRTGSIPVTALESWRIAHCMASIGEGYAWPEITFFADGNEERISCQAQEERDRQNQPMRFVAALEAVCPKEVFVNASMCLMKVVASRVGDTAPDFLSAWVQLEEEYADENIANYRIIEAMLGHETGYAPQALMNKVIAALDRIGWDALCETAGGLNPVYGCEFANQAVDLEKALTDMASGITARIALPRMKPDEVPPWEAGRRLARRVRELTGLGPEKPLGKTLLLDWMGLTANRFNRIATAGPVSICQVRGREATLVFPLRGAGKYATSRLFQLARALGGFLLLPLESRSMVMSSSQTAAQQIQRNFAAELLAPFATIKAMLPGGRRPAKKDIESIADHFQTSPRTIVHSLVNQGALEAESGKMLLA